ncbi:MAG: hypothetical protein KAX55_01475 [Propionivibrio sp.]|nr:hypothetical protein [Propionivibrio sp.]
MNIIKFPAKKAVQGASSTDTKQGEYRAQMKEFLTHELPIVLVGTAAITLGIVVWFAGLSYWFAAVIWGVLVIPYLGGRWPNKP